MANGSEKYQADRGNNQKESSEAGKKTAKVAAKAAQEKAKAEDPILRKEWDEKYGDRMIKLVFIGQKLDKEKITAELDACLTE